MTGNEDIKIGDKLVRISKEGYLNIGSRRTVRGLKENLINFTDSDLGWINRKDFRWDCFIHLPTTEPEMSEDKHV